MISLKTTTLLAMALSATLLGACGPPGQGTANSTESDGGAITPVGENADSVAPSGESASEEITEGINTEDANDAVASFINTASGVAIKGTDPVAYFTEGQPVAGSKEFSHRWNGVRWNFVSAENR
ncbi:MAG: hypothetical protein AAGA67_02365, partial [Cyanobacteria bacterium P01_F01_bin.153]